MLKEFKVVTKYDVFSIYAEKFEITPSGVAVFKNYKDENIEAISDFHRIVFAGLSE